MEFDLRRLISNIDEEVVIDTTYSFTEEELKGSGLLKLDNVSVNGNITKDSLNNLVINVDIKGTMVLPCSITLKPVDYPFNINVNGNIEDMLEEMGKFDKKIQNTLDILPIIWENILLEVPMKVVSENAKLDKTCGDGWKLITEDDL